MVNMFDGSENEFFDFGICELLLCVFNDIIGFWYNVGKSSVVFIV